MKAATLAINQAAAAAGAAAALASSLAAAVSLPDVPGYEIVDWLGRGGFGAVYLARAGGREFAVKVVQHGGCEAGGSRYADYDPEEAEHEAAMHRRLAATQHPAAVPLCELIAESDRSVLIVERVTGCELAKHMSAQPHGRLSEAEARDAARQLLSALHCFHTTAGVAHMDIKPENVMRQPDGVLRLIDYGGAETFDPAVGLDNAWVDDNGGTEAYQAPERLDGGSLLDYEGTDEFGRVRGPAADVYSLGVLLFELLCGEAPFDFGCDESGQIVDSYAAAFERLSEGDLGFERQEWRETSDEAKELVALAMHAEPLERPSAEELLAHEWLCGEVAEDEGEGEGECEGEEEDDTSLCVAALAAALPTV